MEFKRININSSLEKRILTGMIVSKEFMDKVHKAYNHEYIESSYIRKTIKWVMDYYTRYNDVPGESIKDIFIANKKKLKEEEFEILDTLIDDILTGYTEGSFNNDYITDQALNFFKTRELSITANNIRYYLDRGEIVEAEREIETYTRITKPNLEINGFIASEDAMNQTFENEDEISLLNLPKSLGKFMGTFQREWLVGISAPFKKGKCLNSLDKILLSNGQVKTVEHIVRNKLTDIVTYNESTGQFQKGQIIDWYNNGEKEVFCVKTRTGREVNITSNHPLLTEKGWIDLSELKIDDSIAVPKILNFFGNKIVKDYKIKVLAYLLADGGITQQYATTFTKNEDIIREDFVDSIIKFGDKCSILCETKVVTLGVVGGNVNQWLKKIGVDRTKSIHKVIPDIVFELPKESLSLFLQTLFTCDGSIHKTNSSYQISYSSGSKELLYQVHHLLLRFGIISTIRYKLGKCKGKRFHHWILELKSKEFILKYCQEIGFRPGRKKEIMIQAIDSIQNLPNNRGFLDLFYDSKSIQKEFEKTEGTKWCRLKDTINSALHSNGGITRCKIQQMYEQTQNPYFKNLFESEILWDKIISIESLGLKQTYDLTVKDHHNFIANDVLVHNTFLLGEFTKAAALSGLKVASFNLEMSLRNMRKRTYMSLTGASEVEGRTIFPCFDCARNQSDSCNKEERMNRVRIPSEFSAKTKYKPCTYCKDMDMDDYEMAIWQEIIDVPKLNYYLVKERITALKKLGKASVWLECMPRFSASVEDIERKLDNLESIHNFVPDVLLIDYADILKSNDPGLKGVEKEDDVWMSLARIASARKMLVVVPTQLNKESLDAKQIKTSHTAKWVGKLGHVDAMFALNQTPPEKELGLMRISILEHRHKDFNETENCYVLQKFSSGSAHLDSYWKDKKSL